MAKKGVEQNSGVEKNIGLVLGGGASAIGGNKTYNLGANLGQSAYEKLSVGGEHISAGKGLMRKARGLAREAADSVDNGTFNVNSYNKLQGEARLAASRGEEFLSLGAKMTRSAGRLGKVGKIVRGAGVAATAAGLGAMFAGLVTDFNSAKSAARDSVKAQSARIKNARKK
jgi:hypothetical protein